MARIDFYVLPSNGEPSRRHFACRLAEKAYRLEHCVHVHMADAPGTREFDELLWTYRDGSFVPHEVLANEQAELEAPITIGHAGRPERTTELLINLSDDIPAAADSFPRIAEIVTSDDESRRRSRKRFSQYRDLGHTLETHKL